jgi:hypothetical protein
MISFKEALSVALAPMLLLCGLLCYATDTQQENRNPQALQGSSERSLDDLQRDRNMLENQIQSVQAEIDALNTQHYWVGAKTRAEEELKAAQNKKTPEGELGPLRKAVNDAATNVTTSSTDEQIVKAIEQKSAELAEKKNKKDVIESEISRKVDLEKPKQDFKKNISAYFAGLIALVILGFFFIASRDETVRREIFAGQAGIQFITLFSLVIAIILFGITEILEGKELSALLGGLSGYILGRSTTATHPSPNSSTTTDQTPDHK